MGLRWASALVALTHLAGGCGEEPKPIRIGFKAHALVCERPGLLAYLQATGVAGICPLQVARDRTVSGVCSGVPTGEIRDFRLVYYTLIDGSEVQLAWVTARLDLRNETRDTIVLEFPSSLVVTDIDDDNDGRSNLEEFCGGTDPRQRD